MAIQNKTLSGAEHDWYATRSGVAGNAPLNDHKRAYYISKGISDIQDGKSKPTTQMEEEWLGTLTGVTAEYFSDKWSQAVSGQGFTPSRDGIDANRFIFFTSVTTSP